MLVPDQNVSNSIQNPLTFSAIYFWPFNLHSPEVTDAIKAEKHIVYRKLALTYPGV